MSSSCLRLLGRLMRLVRALAGISQTEMAVKLELSQPTVSRWERGEILPSREKLQLWFQACSGNSEPQHVEDINGAFKAAEYLQRLTPGEDADRGAESASRILHQLARQAACSNQALVPVFADVAAGHGEWQEALLGPRGHTEVPASLLERDPGCYAMRVVGDSMAPLMLPGDVVIVSPLARPVNGSIVAAFVEPDGDVVKQYLKLPDGSIQLAPINKEYQAVVLEPGGEQDIRIWGRVVFQQREV